MVSERRPAPSMPASEVSTSGGIFLFSFTYWSNWASSVLRIASTSLESGSSRGDRGSISASKLALSVSTRSMRARCTPSTSTFTVPSGSFSICRMVETVPTS